jgi:hypothetical protein
LGSSSKVSWVRVVLWTVALALVLAAGVGMFIHVEPARRAPPPKGGSAGLRGAVIEVDANTAGTIPPPRSFGASG